MFCIAEGLHYLCRDLDYEYMKALTDILRIALVILLPASIQTHACCAKVSSINNLLDSLDKVVEQRQAAIVKRQTVLNDFKRSLEERMTPGAVSEKCRIISTEYIHFNSDSAIYYARMAVDAAEKTNNKDAIMLSDFSLLKAYTRQGTIGKAYEVISKIGNIDSLAPSYQPTYAALLLDFYDRINLSGESKEAKEAWKRYGKYLNKNSADYDYFVTFITGKCDIRRVEKHIDDLPQPSFIRALLYYALANEYKRRGEMEMSNSYLILSAINDILLGNTETASLLGLVQTPLLEKDLKRSSAYIQVCVDNAKQYNDRLRALSIMDVQSQINKRFNAAQTRQMLAITVIAVLFFISLVISILSTRMSVARGRKVKDSLEKLKVMHTKQTELVDQQKMLGEELKKANLRLGDRLAAYRNDFVNVYQLVSTYISYEKNMFKNLLNQLRTNNVRKVISILNSGTDIDVQLKNFYQHFDHAFLSMYPDFIHRMNTLLKPDCQLDESMTELTTTLRIYALLLLGVNDGAGIADFLHISSQTIYNYRLRMRRQAINGDKRFDEDVAHLY